MALPCFAMEVPGLVRPTLGKRENTIHDEREKYIANRL